MARILVITQRVPFPPNKGEKLRTFHQIEYLCQLGYEVIVFSPTESIGDTEQAQQLSNKLSIKVITHPLRHKLFRYASGLLQNRSLSESNFFSNGLLAKIKPYAQSCEAIMCTASSLAKYVFELSNTELQQKPALLMDFMDVDSDKWQQYADASTWPMRSVYLREHKLIKALETQVIKRFDSAFLIAQAEYDLFQASVCTCANLRILGNGIDQNEFSPASKNDETIDLLFTGVMDYKPNVDAVLWFVDNCWDEIKAQLPKVRLTIAGMNPEPKLLALSNDDQIEVTGFVDDIMPYFNRATIFIAPFQIARGVQNKVLQAMACGIPVVSTSLGAEGIVSKHNSNMIIAESAASFISANLLLATDTKLREKIGHQANKTITDYYSWSSVLEPLKTALIEHGVSNEINS